MGEEGTAHHRTKKQQRLRRADDKSVRSGLGDSFVCSERHVYRCTGRAGAYVLIQGHSPASMREMSMVVSSRQAIYQG